MTNTRRWIGLFLLVTAFAPLAQATPAVRPGFQWEAVSRIAIQDRGRTKPLDTFAEESVLYITGRRAWKGMSAIECLFSWLIAYDQEWANESFLRIDYAPLKTAMKLNTSENYFNAEVLRGNEGLRQIVRDAMQKEQRKERLNELEKKAMQVQNQRGLLEAIVTGQAFTILPNPEGAAKPWFSMVTLTDPNAGLPYPPELRETLGKDLRAVLNAFITRDPRSWNESTYNLETFLRRDLSAGQYPTVAELQREVQYNHLRPFRWAWSLYALAFCLLMTFLVSNSRIAQWGGFAALMGGFFIHAYGFGMRCLIAGRPPVTNMYESVIWVSWGCVLFSLFIWLAYKNAIIPTAATVFAVVGLVLADNLPLALDPAINPLEPVLRSNYWLTIHVLTITLSYAAFALSLCLGNVVLFNYVVRPKATAHIQQLNLYMYRAMQIGVVLIAAGTILGGIWADYSWGRFWGWDPKEVWALIALLLYLAVLHGRFTGWLKGFGFVATTVMCFLGVLMAWYGVNFVLGVGLHSYGFSSGGTTYVLSYVAAQLGFIGLAYQRYAKTRDHGGVEPTIFPRAGVS